MPTRAEMFAARIAGTTPRRFFNIKQVHGGFTVEAGTRYQVPATGAVVAETVDKTVISYNTEADESTRNASVAALQLAVGNYVLHGNFDGDN